MRKMRFILLFFVLVLPLAGRPQQIDVSQGQRQFDAQQQQNQQAGGQVGQQQQPWDGLPAGRRGNCNDLTGQNGMLSRQSIRIGNVTYNTCFGWDPNGNLNGIVDPAGFLSHFQYDLLRRSTLIRNQQGEETSFTYNASSQIDSIIRSNTFNPNNDPANRTVQYQYDSMGNVTSQQIGGGVRTRQVFDPDDRLKSAIGPDGALGTIQAYTLGRIESMGVGLVNERGEPTLETLGRTRYQYDVSGRVSSVSDGADHWTTFRYDDMGRVQDIVNPDSSSVTNQYDDANRLRKREVKDRNGNVLTRVESDYDNMDRVKEMRISKPGDAAVWKTTWTYQDNGSTVIESHSINNVQYRTSTLRYDGLNRLISSESPEVGTIATTYDTRGLIQSVSHSVLGMLQRFSHDALGRLEFVVDGLNNFVRQEYNGLGNLARIFRSGTETVQMQYDNNGRLISQDTGAAQHLGYVYDEAGRLQGMDFGAFPGSRSSYQRETGLLANTAIGEQTVYQVLERNANGQVVRARDANGITFTHYYDAMGRLIQIGAQKDGGSQYRAWSYYDDGRVKAVGESVALPPDRFPEFRGPGGAGMIAVAQQVVNRILGRPTYDNRLKSVVWFVYDPAGNVVEESRWIQGRWLATTIALTGQNNGLVTTVTYPSGYRMQRNVDQAGRLRSVMGLLANGQRRGEFFYDYPANNPRLERIRFGTEITENYTYDSANRLTSLIVSKTAVGGAARQLARMDYKYSPRSLLIAKKELISPVANRNVEKANTFGFDDLGRAVFWSAVTAQQVDGVVNNGAALAPSNSDALQRYFFNQKNERTKTSTKDAAGSLMGSAQAGRAFEYTLRGDGAAQTARQSACYLTQEGALAGCQANVAAVDIAFNPDADGNLQAARAGNAAGPTYVYNSFGQLVEVNEPANRNRRIQYYYDGFGRVITREVYENQRKVADHQFIWDGPFLSEIREITRRNRSDEVTQEIIYSFLYGESPSDILASYDRRFTRYHHSHPDGSTFLLTDRGTVTQWYRFSPFGETQIYEWAGNRETKKNLNQSKTSLLFGGSYMDPLTGFYFLGSWFDPVHGHTLSAGGGY